MERKVQMNRWSWPDRPCHTPYRLCRFERTSSCKSETLRIRQKEKSPCVANTDPVPQRTPGRGTEYSRRRNQVHNRTPILLAFLVELPSVEARGRWRERGRMRRGRG